MIKRLIDINDMASVINYYVSGDDMAESNLTYHGYTFDNLPLEEAEKILAEIDDINPSMLDIYLEWVNR
jgi:hypothetical protein